MSRQRFIHHDVPSQSRGDIVELHHPSTRVFAIPLLRIRIALDIKLNPANR